MMAVTSYRTWFCDAVTRPRWARRFDGTSGHCLVLAGRPPRKGGTPHWESSNVLQTRPGYTLAEMLIVVVIVGGLALFSLPKFSGLTERSNIAAARQQVTAAIATARAAAIQKGSSATVRIVGDSLSVTVVNAGGVGTTTVIAPKPLHDLYGVVLSHKNLVDTTITFDTRGFARLGATAIIRLAKGARRDSVCLTISGQIMPRGCSL